MTSFVHTFGTNLRAPLMSTNASGIYAIKAPSGNMYIGSAVNLRRRWNGHRNRLARGTHHCPRLQAAFAKYGDLLEYVVLEYVAPGELIAREQKYIDEFTPVLYNVCPTAGSRLGRAQSSATREKIAAYQRGRARSDETRARMSAAQVGREVSESTRAKIGAAAKGRKATDETRQKQSAALQGRAHKDNTTGFPGVGFIARLGKFRARLGNRHLGMFATAEEAYAAVCGARNA